MSRVRVKGFQIFSDRHGKMRCYHRKTRTSIDLSKAPLGSAEFFAECEKIAAKSRSRKTEKLGSLGHLVSAWRASPEFSDDLAERTRKDYQRILDYLQPIDDTPLFSFDRPLIARIRDKAAKKHGRRFGNYVKAVLSSMFSWGVERGFLKENPAIGVRMIKRAKDAPTRNRPWSDEERFAVLRAAPLHLKTPIALAMYTGLREGDVLSLTWKAYDGTKIVHKTNKAGVTVEWPVPFALKNVLQEQTQKRTLTIAATSRGTPWTQSGFRASWRKLRLRLEKEGKVETGLTIHGLRHTVGTILAEEGFDDATIATALGQKTTAMARHYSKSADRSRTMKKVVQRFDDAENRRRTEIVKPSAKSVKPDVTRQLLWPRREYPGFAGNLRKALESARLFGIYPKIVHDNWFGQVVPESRCATATLASAETALNGAFAQLLGPASKTERCGSGK